MLPTFAVIFLGSTQFTPRRRNVFGSLIGVYLTTFGVKGLLPSGAQNWVTNLFDGAALLVAVGLSKSTRGTLTGRLRRNRSRR